MAQGSRSSMALASSVLLLGAGYVLLVAAPLVLQRLPLPGRTWDGAANGSWFPAAAASGLAIGGAAALIYVLGRLVREVEHQPYACLAPVLGVFAAFVLAGLHVKLPMPGLLSEHFGVLAMAVAVVGGALVQQKGVLSGLLGSLLTVLPTVVLCAILWVGSGQGDLHATLSAMDSQVRVFAVLMSVSSLAMLAIALVARAIVNAERTVVQAPAQPMRISDDEEVWEKLRYQADTNTPRLAMTGLGIPDNEAYLPWSDEFPMPAKSGAPRWLVIMLVLAGLGMAGALGFRLYQQYQARTEAAALAQRADQERKARELAAVQAEASAVNAAQAKEAEERLAAMLAPKAAQPATPVAAVAEQAEAPAQAADSASAAPVLAAAAPAAAPAPSEEEPAQALVASRDEDEAEEAARDAETAERRARRAANRAKKRVKQVKAERAEKAKDRAEQKSNEAAQRSVSKTLNPSNDPILGLLEE